VIKKFFFSFHRDGLRGLPDTRSLQALLRVTDRLNPALVFIMPLDNFTVDSLKVSACYPQRYADAGAKLARATLPEAFFCVTSEMREVAIGRRLVRSLFTRVRQ